jgi:tetratricopeptide (TPR) repeat protein
VTTRARSRRSEKAIEAYKDAFFKDEQAREVAISSCRNGLGNAFRDLGKFDESAAAFQDAIRAVEKARIKNMGMLLMYRVNHARSLVRLGKLKEAENSYEIIGRHFESGRPAGRPDP